MSRKFEYFDRNKRPKLEYPKSTGEYIDYEIKQVKKSTGPNADDFEIEEKVIENKTNIKEFINSFADQVGVENILKKVALTGDTSLLNQVPEVHGDMSIIPEDAGEKFRMAKSAQEAYSKIDPELTQGQSMEEFIKGLNADKINAYIEAKINAKAAEKKEEVKE